MCKKNIETFSDKILKIKKKLQTNYNKKGSVFYFFYKQNTLGKNKVQSLEVKIENIPIHFYCKNQQIKVIRNYGSQSYSKAEIETIENNKQPALL